MDSTLAVVQARQTLEKLTRLRDDVRTFANHAGTLSLMSTDLDSRLLLQEADRLLRNLAAARNDFQSAKSNIESLSRSLPSAPSRGGLAPAAQWVPQLRAASKHFAEAVGDAETKLLRLYDAATVAMNRANRTSTDPDNVFEILVNFSEALTRWMEYRKRMQRKRPAT